MKKDYLYFPGCHVKNIDKKFDELVRKVSKRIGINLIDVDEFSCCGKNTLSDANEFLNYIVLARNLSYADKYGIDILTPCSVCFNSLRKARQDLLSDNKLMLRVNSHLNKFNLEFTGKSDVKTFLHAVAIDMGLEFESYAELKNHSIGCFYGCQTIRPNKKLGNFNERNTMIFEMLIRKLNANVVLFEKKFSCCGYHLIDVDKKITKKMVNECITCAKTQKIDFLVTPCIYCKVAFENIQCDKRKEKKMILKKDESYKEFKNIHIVQLLGIAIGLSKKECGL
jgi:succinate dehydrogenase / fumarate reductase, cytochrome b subunit